MARRNKERVTRTFQLSNKRKRLQGGDRKILSEEMVNQLLEWIFKCQSKMLCVSGKPIRKKAKMKFMEIWNYRARIVVKKNHCSPERSWSFNSKNFPMYSVFEIHLGTCQLSRIAPKEICVFSKVLQQTIEALKLS